MASLNTVTMSFSLVARDGRHGWRVLIGGISEQTAQSELKVARRSCSWTECRIIPDDSVIEIPNKRVAGAPAVQIMEFN